MWWKEGNLGEKASQLEKTIQFLVQHCQNSLRTQLLERNGDKRIRTFNIDVIKSVHDNFNVNNYLMIVPIESTAIEHVQKIRRLLSSGRFRLHKWDVNKQASNGNN